MDKLEFWAVHKTPEGFTVAPVFIEMTRKRYEFDTECAAIAAKHSLDARWNVKWDRDAFPHLHYRPDAPKRLRTLTVSNNKGVTSSIAIRSQTAKAIMIGGQWVPRKALRAVGPVTFLKRWFTDQLTREDQLKLNLV